MKYDHVIVKGDLNLGNFKSSAKDDRKLVTGKIVVTDSLIQGKLDFSNVFFEDFIDFSNTRFFQEALFERAAFKCGADFSRARFELSAIFEKTMYCPNYWYEKALGFSFVGSLFMGRASFSEAIVKDDGNFEKAGFFKHADFSKATFGRLILSDAGILDYIDLEDLNTNHINLYNTVFFNPCYQQNAFRKAKKLAEASGDKGEADYYHFKEMEGKRKANGIPFEVLYDWDEVRDIESENRVSYPKNKNELIYSLANAIKGRKWRHLSDFIEYNVLEYIFIQLIFGYGVRPKRLMISWGIIVIAFGILYWIGNGITGATEWFDYLKVSFATAIAPGYIANIINPGKYRIQTCCGILSSSGDDRDNSWNLHVGGFHHYLREEIYEMRQPSKDIAGGPAIQLWRNRYVKRRLLLSEPIRVSQALPDICPWKKIQILSAIGQDLKHFCAVTKKFVLHFGSGHIKAPHFSCQLPDSRQSFLLTCRLFRRH